MPVVAEEFTRIGAISVAKAGIRTLAAATILAHGTDLHKEKFLRRILTGEDTWCQLFSEPGSGSDVAGAVTRAEMSGNKWIVNGQKVWTTSAHHAHWGLLLARTDWDLTQHKGLSYFIIDMHQPGVNVQPLKQMNGHASFNQVFMTDAVVEPEFLVANVGDGWAVTTTTLMHERRGADGLRTWAMGSDRKGRAYDEERAEIATTMEPCKLVSAARRPGRSDPVARQGDRPSRRSGGAAGDRPAAGHGVQGRRMDGAPRPRRRPAGQAARAGRLARQAGPRATSPAPAARVRTQLSGADALLSGSDSPLNGTIAEILVSVAGHVDRRRHRRDPAQHHLRARPQDAQGAEHRHDEAFPRRAAQHGAISQQRHFGFQQAEIVPRHSWYWRGA